VKQLTLEEAVEFMDDQKWKEMTPLEIAKFQVQQERLCMPMSVFSVSVEYVLGCRIMIRDWICDSKKITAEILAK
jgi:hypothetical protein